MIEQIAKTAHAIHRAYCMDSEDYDKAAKKNGWLKFDNNSECRYNDDWDFAMVTHYSHT